MGSKLYSKIKAHKNFAEQTEYGHHDKSNRTFLLTWVLKDSSVRLLIFSPKQTRNSSIFLSTTSELLRKEEL